MMKTRNILLDTSIVLDSIDNITNIDKEANVFVTDVVLRELDGNKGAEGAKGYNAREFFRQFNSNEFTALNKMPITNAPLQKNDTLTEGSINSGAHIFTLSRKWYRNRDINDSKIIEMAQDYDLTLNTLDQAQSARAKSVGVKAFIFNLNLSRKMLRSDIFIVVSINFYLASMMFVGSSEEYIKNDYALYLIFGIVGTMIYWIVLNKILKSKESVQLKLITIFTSSIGLMLSSFKDMKEHLFLFLFGITFLFFGAIQISKMDIEFSFLKARYGNSGKKIKDNEELINSESNWHEKNLEFGRDVSKSDEAIYL